MKNSSWSGNPLKVTFRSGLGAWLVSCPFFYKYKEEVQLVEESMTLILSVYHIIGIMVSVTIVFTVFYKQLKKNLSISWNEDIEGELKSYKENNDLELKWRKDIYKALDDFENAIEVKIERQIGNKFELLSKDLRVLTEGMGDLKEILGKQQETLLAIQLNVSEIKPKIVSLEKRVDKLENKLENR